MKKYIIIFTEEDKMKKLIRLTEGDLHRIIENSVKRVLKEYNHNSSFGKKLDMADMEAKHGNGNIDDKQGRAAMAAMSDDDEISDIAKRDKGIGRRPKYKGDKE